MAIPNIVLGTILLLFGRKLFWLFVGIAGFLVGMELSTELLSDQPEWVRWVASIGVGLIGALLAVVAQRVAFAIGGFFAGSYIALAAVAHFGTETSPNILVVVGGVVGAVIAAIIMDAAIIVLASLVGAGAIVQAINVNQSARSLLFLGLVAVGILVQFKLMARSKYQELEHREP
jgi:hypothetical protein